MIRFSGDINGDRTVNAADFVYMRMAFGGYDPALDFDGDGLLDILVGELMRRHPRLLGVATS